MLLGIGRALAVLGGFGDRSVDFWVTAHLLLHDFRIPELSLCEEVLSRWAKSDVRRLESSSINRRCVLAVELKCCSNFGDFLV